MTAKSFALIVLLAVSASARTIDENAAAARVPPPAEKAALMARYIVNEADWTSIATVSVRENSKNYPFVNLVSLSDGLKGKGSGVPYVFVTPLDFTGQDVKKDQRATMMMSLVQGNYCSEKGYDPMDPRCARVIFSGKLKQILETDAEYKVAKEAMFGRHPWLANMPPNHNFYIAKLEVESIAVLAKFGGVAWVKVNEYYQADVNAVDEFARKYK